jgi:hypothetical protein
MNLLILAYAANNTVTAAIKSWLIVPEFDQLLLLLRTHSTFNYSHFLGYPMNFNPTQADAFLQLQDACTGTATAIKLQI